MRHEDSRSGRAKILRKAAERLKKGAEPAEQNNALSVVSAATVSGQGKREYQQDAFALSGVSDSGGSVFAAALCDGMGGMADGRRIADDTVKRALRLCLEGGDCAAGIADISREIYEKYSGAGGATLAMIRIRGGMLEFWSVGDSDVYLLRRGRLCRLNARHTHMSELLRQVAMRRIDFEEACRSVQRGALSQYMGEKSVVPDSFQTPFALVSGDTLMLCSDGVSGTLSERRLAHMLTFTPQACCDAIEREIIEADRSGQDNYSAVVVRF